MILVDPEYVQDYLDLPLMERITYMMCMSFQDVIANATCGGSIICALATVERDGSITIYTPLNGLDFYSFKAKHSACSEEDDEYIVTEMYSELTRNAKEDELSQNGEPRYPIRKPALLAEIDEKKVYWCPVTGVANPQICRNELFVRLCDEFGHKWGRFLSKNDIKEYNEFWDETSRRAIGTPNLFLEYTTCLLLSDRFHLDDYEGDGEKIFACLNSLSSQPYEGRSCKGMICFLKKGIRDYRMVLTFQEEKHILERSVRENRKLLEMTDDHHAMIIQEGYILGIGKKDLGDERIRFFGNSKWTFEKSDGDVVFQCEAGDIRIIGKPNDSYIRYMLTEQFGDECDSQVIIDLISAACKQKHGTGIVITDKASEEAQRLFDAGRDIITQPFYIGDHIESISAITRIDGALIINPHGSCYAVGAIVDGESVITGSPARGARYNSLANYVAWQQSLERKCLAVVISEDGTVDVVLSKEEIDERSLSNG